MKGFFKMLKNAPKAKVAKLAYAFVGVIVSGAILVAATTSVAWFSHNRKTDANEMQIKTLQDDTEAQYSVYKWDFEEGDIENGHGTNVDSESNPLTLGTGFKLNTHDVVFTSENEYNPAFVRIELTGSKYEGKSGSLTVTLTRSTAKDDANNVLTETLSSVAQFACTTGAVAYVEDADPVYKNAFAMFCNEDDGKLKESGDFTRARFTTYDTNTDGEGNHTYSNFQKTNQLQFTVNYNAGDWTDGKLYIYLCICYDEILAEMVARGNTDFSAFLDIGTSKEMENDLSEIYVSFVEPTL